MKQSGFIRNVSGTCLVLGVALSTMSYNNTSCVAELDYKESYVSDYNDYSSSSYIVGEVTPVFEEESVTQLEETMEQLFGKMREATKEERASVNDYIDGIAKETGVNFFDLC